MGEAIAIACCLIAAALIGGALIGSILDKREGDGNSGPLPPGSNHPELERWK